MSIHRNLMTVCFAAVFALGLAACSSSSDDDPPEMAMPEPMPEPEPDPGPTDLEETQAAAAAAAAAAMTASTNAGASASDAADATANIATLQTGGMAMMYAMGADDAAGEAAAAAAAAATASAAAAAATTAPDAEAAWAMAVSAQGDAEAAEAMAAEMAASAMEAAMTELHIDGAMKNVGDSSVDANTGTLTSPDGKVSTGFQGMVSRPAAAVEGQHFIQNQGAATETKYKQAVEAGSVNIGKMVDTSDDAARLTIIHSHQDSKTVRVFVDGNGEATDATLNGMLAAAVTGLDGFPLAADADTTEDGEQTATVKSIGIYYLANDRATLPAATEVIGDPASDAGAGGDNALNAYDQVDLEDGGQPHEIFEISYGANTHHVRVVETITDDQGNTAKHYQPVDIMANVSMTDGDDPDATPDNLRPVTVSIPVATEYNHIHFGLWAGLNDKGAAIADLGIGFVQNIDGSGVTQRQGIGSASYSGDWVAAVRRQYASDADAGAINMYDGRASLTADFEKGEFTGNLTGLATLEGTLAGNGFSGTSATASHADLDNAGSFDGSFSGGIYGPTGSEAAGVFSFDGGEAGAFVGAFGGTQ